MSGRLVIMGSGEIAPTLLGAHRAGIEAARATSVTIVDTPFGFQTNVRHLTEKLTDFFRTSLVIDTEVASLRRADVATVERERALALVRRSRYVFAGPGSPSYALGVWHGAGMADAFGEVIASGGTVTFASAAALTVGIKTIPVYEIYKVGADPHWLDGLNLTAAYGLPLVAIPHWNNAEGGNHDTSRCYIGEERLGRLSEGLLWGMLGVDEHTAAMLDFGTGRLTVSGRGTVTLRAATERVVTSGEGLDLDEVREHFAVSPTPAPHPSTAAPIPETDLDAWLEAILEMESLAAADPAARPKLRAMIVELGDAARIGLADPREAIAGFVDLALEMRHVARRDGRYEESDRIRRGLEELGVEVRDTPDGVQWGLRP